MRTKKMEAVMSLLLTLGTLFSAALVLVGGVLYLLQSGGQIVHFDSLQGHAVHMTIKQVWMVALSFSPLGIIELGLLSLVATQILRVGLLTWFYASIRDWWFTNISLFVLLTLIYSFILRR